ncbi:MAG TPA: type III polyketide synthase [Bacteroidia bacterium]|jgi:alpha-pyrone synthase|nr:type III polyketide synthase [Bacteroidia bacterium]
MPHILDISTAVPDFLITNENLIKFYSEALEAEDKNAITKKLTFLSGKTKINKRYSCIPDFKGNSYELYKDGNSNRPVEERMELYKKNIMPLASKAINIVLSETGIETNDITHLITVSCTGLFAPGFEFLVAEKYKLQNTEKIALNFMGCYAGLKALKHAHYIAQADPTACILIVSAELCSLHFYPSDSDEDILSNLLFADGAAAVVVCGNESKHIQNKLTLSIDSIGTSYIPNTMNLMTWNISSSAFRMYLSRNIADAIKENVHSVVNDFLGNGINETEHWAIHPGGAKIVEAVQESLQLSESNVEDSMNVLREYGNMSSPTILFILSRILNKIKKENPVPTAIGTKKIFACAFGPGLNIEMAGLSSVDARLLKTNINSTVSYAAQ